MVDRVGVAVLDSPAEQVFSRPFSRQLNYPPLYHFS